MSAYRLNVSDELSVSVSAPPPRRMRAWIIVAISVAAHAAAFGAAFAMRAKEPLQPRTEVVRVLAGHVDETGAFLAMGMADARVRK